MKGFRDLGFRIYGLEFRVLVLRGLGLRESHFTKNFSIKWKRTWNMKWELGLQRGFLR